MRKLYLFFIGLLLSGFDLSGQTTTVTYTPSIADYANPERGIYHFTETHSTGYTPLVQADLQNYRTTENVTLIYRIFNLENFVSSPISAAYLAQMQTDFNRIRAAGIKCIVRFAYTDQAVGWPPASPYGDATKAWMLQHIAQLEPYLQSNSDVIAVVQAGFIGIWGEWYYTTYFGDPLDGAPTAANYADRKEVLDRLLLAVPANRMIQVRTPYYKYRFYRAGALTPVSAAEAYNGSAVSRIGHHNDCFLASPTDFGTYVNTTTEYPYLNADTRYTPMGGETCQLNAPRSDCAGDALNELGNFHWSYLNRDYLNTIWNDWIAQGCSLTVKKNLGYRIQLNSGTYSTTAKPGGSFSINLSLSNIGWAAFFNPRKVEIVLQNTSDGTICRAQLSDDPRLWMSGSSYVLNYQIGIPANYPNGIYKVYLSLPDPETALYENAAYSVRVANTNTTWDATKGYNYLAFDLNINNSVVAPDYTGSLWFQNCYGGLPVNWLSVKAEAAQEHTLIRWTVAQEKEVHHYAVERSEDGIDFSAIGEVPVDRSLNYHYYDVLHDDKVYYRIAQHALDGSLEYSPVCSVEFTSPQAYFISPTPFTRHTYIFPETSAIEDAEVIVQDLKGSRITQERYRFTGIPISIGESLSPGLYIVKIITRDKVYFFKIIKA